MCKASPFDGVFDFPRLRSLRVRNYKITADILAALLNTPLRELELGHTHRYNWQSLGPVIKTCSPLRYLRAFVFGPLTSKNVNILTGFMRKRPDLHKISIGCSPGEILDKHVVPLLASGIFKDLTSLALH